MKTAICYISADKPELVKQSLPPLVEGADREQYDLFIADGSRTLEGENTVCEMTLLSRRTRLAANIRGGAGAAIVYALTWMLNHEEEFTRVGLVENDVLLPVGWFDATAALFAAGERDGLAVGAVSARCYADRVLFQRSGFAVCHNLGAGMVLFTRQAARLVLDHFRTGWTTDNRRVFAQLAGIDIGSYWAFRTNEHCTTADWHWETVLACHGLAALALTPSPVEMIGQNPPLAEQGLEIVKGPSEQPVDAKVYDAQRSDEKFKLFANRLQLIQNGTGALRAETRFHFNPNTGTWTFFPHQMHMLGGDYSGDWGFAECRGWGTFKWVADETERTSPSDSFPVLTVPIFGPCSVLVSGGKSGGRVEVIDEYSGYRAVPDLPPEGEQGQVLQLEIPGGMTYRQIRITALSLGVCFYGLQTREPQPFDPSAKFDFSVLPCPAP